MSGENDRCTHSHTHTHKLTHTHIHTHAHTHTHTTHTHMYIHIHTHRHGTTQVDFDLSKRRAPVAHVIAARITAENPDAGFRPTSGVLQEINFRVSPQVVGYFSASIFCLHFFGTSA